MEKLWWDGFIAGMILPASILFLLRGTGLFFKFAEKNQKGKRGKNKDE